MSKLGKLELFFRELREHKTILAWIYSLFYIGLVTYCIITNPATMSKAIEVTGGVVTIIFTSYVTSDAYIKVKKPKDDASQIV